MDLIIRILVKVEVDLIIDHINWIPEMVAHQLWAWGHWSREKWGKIVFLTKNVLSICTYPRSYFWNSRLFGFSWLFPDDGRPCFLMENLAKHTFTSRGLILQSSDLRVLPITGCFKLVRWISDSLSNLNTLSALIYIIKFKVSFFFFFI